VFLLFPTGCASPKRRLEGLGIEGGIGDWRVRYVSRFMPWRLFAESDRALEYRVRGVPPPVKREGSFVLPYPPGGREIVSRKATVNRESKDSRLDRT